MASPTIPTATTITDEKVAVLNTNAISSTSQLPSPPPRGQGRINADITIAPAQLADDEIFVNSLTNLINEIYTDAERGFWSIDPFTRTNPDEVRSFITSGTLAVAWTPGTSRYYIEYLLGCGRVKLLSPEPDTRATAHSNPDPDTQIGQFGCLICRPEYRGSGVGRDLLKFAESWAKEKGAKKMQVELVVGDGWDHEEKVKLAGWYERAGYRNVKEVDLEQGIPELGPLLAKKAKYRKTSPPPPSLATTLPTPASRAPPKTALSSTLETGASLSQDFAPVKSICAHLNAFHVYASDPSRIVETNHYCAHLTEDVRQCILYDSPNPGARILGIEYMITPKLYETLPQEERRYWHTHVFEVKSGMLIMPKPTGVMPQAVWEKAERTEMEQVVTLYGKIYHLWQVDRGDKLPMGEPQLMTSFTEEGQFKDMEKVLDERDKRFPGADWRAKRESRKDIEVPEMHPDADWTWKKDKQQQQ
ncbi:unnamed protein product [Sordaria macrospora k-hell]|uniref:WGS project CABT00000000 data, contig 2.47 n=1 Tax=Sordaria macrospora (strain ATCC MYA-333 / DSM 997 / K(L3346) / K-hell) TaxID=771870 RepID=F7W8W7_SORMK|nr:uncharacterized protein SMAC_07746 [Sordaria macrospora k-hell]CCC05090.1 unnamed protein product [Sordaria macrospora k-hell]